MHKYGGVNLEKDKTVRRVIHFTRLALKKAVMNVMRKEIRQTFFLGKDNGQVQICHGDSGGPLYAQKRKEDYVYET